MPINLTKDGLPFVPEVPAKPLHFFSLAECQRGASEYFPDPVGFKKRKTVFYCYDKGTGKVWGHGNSYGAALVDAFAKMELRKKQARESHEMTKALADANYAKAHPIKSRLKKVWHRLKGGK